MILVVFLLSLSRHWVCRHVFESCLHFSFCEATTGSREGKAIKVILRRSKVFTLESWALTYWNNLWCCIFSHFQFSGLCAPSYWTSVEHRILSCPVLPFGQHFSKTSKDPYMFAMIILFKTLFGPQRKVRYQN